MADGLEMHVLPAGHGDCLWIEYGDSQQRHRVLIDGGTQGTYKQIHQRLSALPPVERRFELLVVTHIDADHIAGVLELMDDSGLGVTYEDIWFNGYRHLPAPEIQDFGAVQGERLTRALLDKRLPWNQAFGNGGAVSTADDGAPVRKTLAGGLELFVLAPTRAQLQRLRPVWDKEVRKAGLDPQTAAEKPVELPRGVQAMGPINVDALADSEFTEDRAPANGSSIALLLRYREKSLLLAGDAYPSTLRQSVRALVHPDARLPVDVFKVPHHGSRNNVDRKLLSILACHRFVVSTNGAYFHHPDREAIARLVKYGGPQAQLAFNYRTEHNDVWDKTSLKNVHRFSTEYADDVHPLVIRL